MYAVLEMKLPLLLPLLLSPPLLSPLLLSPHNSPPPLLHHASPALRCREALHPSQCSVHTRGRLLAKRVPPYIIRVHDTR